MEPIDFYQEKQSKATFEKPFTYDRVWKAILNAKGERIMIIHGHMMKTLDQDIHEFGEMVVKLLND